MRASALRPPRRAAAQAPRTAPARPPPTARRGALVAVASSAFSVTVRPYTLRQGDSLESIAEKRDISTKEVLAINPDVTSDNLAPGKTILLPAGKLSRRDKDILDGIGPGYRVYPVRAGENLTDIISKRNIKRQELEQLNPGIDLDSLKANTLLKLPTNKFTVREREMLVGSGILPPEFFQAASNPFVIGVGALMMVCGFVLAWQKFYADPDYLADE